MSTLLWSYRPMEAQLHTHTQGNIFGSWWSGDFLLSFHPSCNLLARRCWRGTNASRSACHWEPTAEWARDLTASSLFEIETGDVRVFVPASLDACISKEACDFIHNCPISFSTGNEDRPFAKARLLNVTWFILIQTWSVSSLGFYWPLMLMRNTARERLARMKSHFNVKLVKRYRDKRGQQKIKGSRDLAKSAEYPIQLGLKAGLYVYVTWVSTAYIYIYICKWHDPRYQSKTTLEINSLQVGSLLSEYVTLGQIIKINIIALHTMFGVVFIISLMTFWLRKEHRPMPVSDAGLHFQNIGDDSSDSGIDHILD